MTVCLDMTSIGAPRARWTGVARTSWDVAQEFLARGEDVRFSAVGTLAAERMAKDHLQAVGLGERVVSAQPGAVVSALMQQGGALATNALRVWNQLRNPIDPAALADMSMFFSFYAGIPKQLRKAGVPCGIYVHDIIPFLFPQYCSTQQQRVLKRILGSIRPGDLIAVNSECTKRDVSAHLGLSPEALVTVPLAADTELFHPVTDPAQIAEVRARYGITAAEYFLTLHSAAPHKNMPRLIRAHAAYRAEREAEALPLVIAGGKGDPRAEVLATGEVSEDDLDGVTFAGFIEDADLAPLYSGARAFLFPSHYEGFGLPVLEALFCGVPVFASDRASLPEVMAPLAAPHGGPDRLIDPEDDAAWTAAFLRAETAPRLDEAARAPLHAQFSWARAADILSSAIQSKLSEKGS